MNVSRLGERLRLLRSPASIEESYKYETGFWIAAQIVSLMPTALGCVILAGGHARFMSPVLRIPASLMPWWLWGFLFVTAGTLFSMMVFRRCWNTLYWGTAASFLYMFFAVSQVLSSVLPGGNPNHPQPLLTGVPTYLGLSILSMVVTVVIAAAKIDRHIAWLRGKIRRG